MKILIILVAMFASACESGSAVDPSVCQFAAPTVTNANGLLHGIACNTSADCKYGTCRKAAMQQGKSSTVGVCTKQCSCGGSLSQCSIDDNIDKNLTFTCIKAYTGSGSECGVTCTSASDCQKINPAQPHCVSGVKNVFTAGARKVCSSQPQS